MPQWSASPWLGVIMFLLLASSLFVFARKKLE
jgi:LPXTG-motif cell wall-anchored protein